MYYVFERMQIIYFEVSFQAAYSLALDFVPPFCGHLDSAVYYRLQSIFCIFRDLFIVVFNFLLLLMLAEMSNLCILKNTTNVPATYSYGKMLTIFRN